MPSIDQIRSDFALLDDWEDRYRYVIELGRGLAPLPPEDHNEANKVRGCASQVWLATDVSRRGQGAPVLNFRGDSDAHIVRGLIAILFALYSGKPAHEIVALDPQPVFAELGLKDHLTQQRSNGLASMVERIRSEGRAAVASSGQAAHVH
jgi:cysteine desulfuration protein SufE